MVTTEMASIAPPRVPSQVLFGDILERGVFPKNDPTMYAMVSLIHKVAIIVTGIIHPRSIANDEPSKTAPSVRNAIHKAILTEIYNNPNKE